MSVMELLASRRTYRRFVFGVISIYVWERKDREVLLLLGN